MYWEWLGVVIVPRVGLDPVLGLQLVVYTILSVGISINQLVLALMFVYDLEKLLVWQMVWLTSTYLVKTVSITKLSARGAGWVSHLRLEIQK